ncbi:MAG: hypothetical protein JXM70_05370, partial [Pirellulales bacterium]|nr:hypothetical protein [Pirellulales bacterium]
RTKYMVCSSRASCKGRKLARTALRSNHRIHRNHHNRHPCRSKDRSKDHNKRRWHTVEHSNTHWQRPPTLIGEPKTRPF